MKILFIAGVDGTLLKFRLELMRELHSQLSAEIFIICRDTNNGFVSSLRESGFIVLPYPIDRSSPVTLNNLKAIFYIKKIISKYRIDTIHCNTPIGGFIGRIAGVFSPVKNIIYTTGGFYFTNNTPWLKRNIFILVEKVLAKCTDIIFSVNREDIDTAKSLKIMPKKNIIYTGGAGVDLNIFNPHSEEIQKQSQEFITQHNLQDKDIVLFLARVVIEKGIHDFIEVSKQIARERPSVVFLIVGPGELDEYSKEQLKDELLINRVITLGRRHDVATIFKLATIYIFPSYREGMPVATLESMAMLTPVIAYDIRGCREEIDNGSTGFLVDFKNKDDMANKALSLLDDESLRNQISEQAYKFVASEFTREKIVERQLKIYRNLS